ncbi:MAG: SMI1/KNR4 family protein [Gemmataceae bacterium]|nr:SMI1/KNR4 family protein [Gemmataceae bacterium]
MPSESEVVDFERGLGVTLPKHYRDFILSYNGGLFCDPYIIGNSPTFPIDQLAELFGIRASLDSLELAAPWRLSLFEDNHPLQVLPIGGTPTGNLLILITRPDPNERGAVVLKMAWKDECHFLADSMEEFFGLLDANRPSTK